MPVDLAGWTDSLPQQVPVDERLGFNPSYGKLIYGCGISMMFILPLGMKPEARPQPNAA